MTFICNVINGNVNVFEIRQFIQEIENYKIWEQIVKSEYDAIKNLQQQKLLEENEIEFIKIWEQIVKSKYDDISKTYQDKIKLFNEYQNEMVEQHEIQKNALFIVILCFIFCGIIMYWCDTSNRSEYSGRTNW